MTVTIPCPGILGKRSALTTIRSPDTVPFVVAHPNDDWPTLGRALIRVLPALLIAFLGVAASAQDAAQTSPADSSGPPTADEQTDLLDLLRKIRPRKPSAQPKAAWDWHKPMRAYAPIIGSKPSTGFVIGAAGNVAFFRGDPSTTHISSAVASLTFSSKKQTSLNLKFGLFTRGDRWHIEGDNRFLWTSQDTYGLGADTTSVDRINMKYDYFRVYETAYYRLRPALFAGLGFHYSAHTDVKPGKDAEQGWDRSPYVIYSQQHGFPLDSQTSAGTSLNLLIDTRDSFINADHGWLADASYRTYFSDFLGGDSTWQELLFETRTYRKLTRDARHKLAFWLYGDFVVGGAAPYMDLPATGMDTYGRSGRGYVEGRFRGDRLLYGEIEYRVSLMRSGLVGMVCFLNTTTISDVQAGQKLFDNYATGGGFGFRLLFNKRSKTNLCLDFGWGKEGSHGVYLALQEAF